MTDKKTMPVLFIGHGSPMNAIEDNEFRREWEAVATRLPRPAAVLCISAHWLTEGTSVTGMASPRTIHDFLGFPEELFAVQYPAPGHPDLAKEIVQSSQDPKISLNKTWGLDHGCWSVIGAMYPKADVPVIQLSLNYRQPLSAHYDLAKSLSALRSKGILIVASGNMVHNLGMLNPGISGYDWAIEANEQMKGYILDGNHAALMDVSSMGHAGALAIPTMDHYAPMLYALALKEKNESISLFNDKLVLGSISMASFVIQ